MSFSSDQNYFKINIKGFDKSFDRSVEFVNEFITTVKEDNKKIKNLVDNAKAGRKIENKESATAGRALRDYVLWGEKSHFLRRLTVKDVKQYQASEYIASFKNAIEYEVDIFYTGRLDFEFVLSSINNILSLPKKPLPSKSPIDIEANQLDENVVYIVNDKKAVQSQIYFGVTGDIVMENERTISHAYNKYFGSGMGSIVFQEIREFRSLAYSCRASYNTPFYNGKKGYLGAYIGCQADKSVEAILTFKDLALNMPEKPDRMNQIRSGLIKSINSSRPSFRSFPGWVSGWIKQGYTDDPRKAQVSFYENMSFDDIVSFQKANIYGKPMVITMLTDVNRINMGELEQFGKIITLTKKDIFN